MQNLDSIENAQPVSLANWYELMHVDELPMIYLSEAEKEDYLNSGQKAAFWALSSRRSPIVVIPSAPSHTVVEHFIREIHGSTPTFISPKPASSSVISSLLCDPQALKQLVDSLDQQIPILLIPYIHTAQVENLHDWLLMNGYKVLYPMKSSNLVRSLWDKAFAHENVFADHPDLARIRPLCSKASTIDEIVKTAVEYRNLGKDLFVVKATMAASGTGIYFLNTSVAEKATNLEELLLASPGVQPIRHPPFLIEEYVPTRFSPTVDLDIRTDKKVNISGVAIQRLRGARFYTGFYFSPEMTSTKWYHSITESAVAVGEKLAELGYVGPANVDFIVTADQSIKLVELNPRHSALFDGFQIATKINGSWNAKEFSVADHVTFSRNQNQDAYQVLDSLSANGVIFVVADSSLIGRPRKLALWVSSREEPSELLLQKCWKVLSGNDIGHALNTESDVPIFEEQVWNLGSH